MAVIKRMFHYRLQQALRRLEIILQLETRKIIMIEKRVHRMDSKGWLDHWQLGIIRGFSVFSLLLRRLLDRAEDDVISMLTLGVVFSPTVVCHWLFSSAADLSRPH